MIACGRRDSKRVCKLRVSLEIFFTFPARGGVPGPAQLPTLALRLPTAWVIDGIRQAIDCETENRPSPRAAAARFLTCTIDGDARQR